VAVVLAAALLGPVAAVAGMSPGPAAAATGPRVVSHAVAFDVENTNSDGTGVACSADDRSYTLRGRLIGPARDVSGLGGSFRADVLVHGLGVGRWFWDMRSHPYYDYATHLARRGETVLVFDRLGYGASRLADGHATCLGAQAEMLHQVVQDLRSGRFRFTDGTRTTPPAAAHVVVQGHGVGAAIAQVEAAAFDDVDGLVLMSWTDRGATALATRAAARQNAACLTSDYAPFATSAAQFQSLMFTSAPRAVQRTAAANRAPDPCGDAASLLPLLAGTNLGAGNVDAPVLLMYGADDKLNRAAARDQQASAYRTPVTTRTFAHSGSALPLEASAGRVRTAVLRWLHRLPS
jgi:alpha-beta hydrolase superfamily lysophospholipase